MKESLYAHEETYTKKNLVSIVHRNRLHAIHKIFEKYAPSKAINWADFGCSNGFITEAIINKKTFQFSRIVGYDHSEELLNLAREKIISNAEFKYFDMNIINEINESFNLITCFETLEHVGDFKNAFINLYNHSDSQGIILLTVPNEIHTIGLIKFLGRFLVRRNPYDDFFAYQSHLEYIKHLVKRGSISIFREPGQLGYGPHLGFDYRELEGFINHEYIATKRLKLIEKHFTGFMMNVVYVYKKDDQ